MVEHRPKTVADTITRKGGGAGKRRKRAARGFPIGRDASLLPEPVAFTSNPGRGEEFRYFVKIYCAGCIWGDCPRKALRTAASVLHEFRDLRWYLAGSKVSRDITTSLDKKSAQRTSLEPESFTCSSVVTRSAHSRIGTRSGFIFSHLIECLWLLLQLFTQAASGGCFQWVLGAVCETVEWPHQPLGLTPSPSVGTRQNCLTSLPAELCLSCFADGSSTQLPKPRLMAGAFAFRPTWNLEPRVGHARIGFKSSSASRCSGTCSPRPRRGGAGRRIGRP